MAELPVIEAGTFEGTSPAAILASALAIGYYGCLTLIGPQTRQCVYLTGGTLAGTGEPVHDVLGAALALDTGRYEVSGDLPDSFTIHDPWRALQAAALCIVGKARLQQWARRLRGVRIEPVASPLAAWAQGIPEAAQTLAQIHGGVLSHAAGEKPRMRTFVNLIVLREIGLIAWDKEANDLGPRPFLWRDLETQARAYASSYEVAEVGETCEALPQEAPPDVEVPAAPDQPAADIEIEISLDAPATQAAGEAPADDTLVPVVSPGAAHAPATAEEPTGATPGAEPPAPATADVAGALLDGSAFDEGLTFLRQGSLGAAKYRFEDHLQFHADDLEAAAYVTWIDLQEDLRDQAARRAAIAALDLALARKRTADLLTFKGSVLRLEGNYPESLACLDEALRLNSRHENARFEREQVRLRMAGDEWPDVNVEDVRIDAAIIVQRRIGSQVKVYSFKQPEIRVGSSDNDDVVVSEAVLPQVARRHCSLTLRDGRIWVRRNASLGRVFVNDCEIEIRKDVPLSADDCVRLGHGTPALEFRAFGFNHLHDVSVLATGGIR